MASTPLPGAPASVNNAKLLKLRPLPQLQLPRKDHAATSTKKILLPLPSHIRLAKWQAEGPAPSAGSVCADPREEKPLEAQPPLGGSSRDEGGAAGRVDEDGGGSGSGRRWALPEETRVRLRELFGKIDKNGNGMLDSEERDEMREEMRLILMELGIWVNVFERLQAGANYAEFEAWFVCEWETASKMQALAGIDIDLLRAAAQSIPSGSPDFPLGGMAGMGPADIARECSTNPCRHALF